MKIDLLLAITMYLLNRETVSAAALAERFEVSKRTIQRDIEVLNQAGIPIVSTFGTNGGYKIMDGFKLTKQIAGVDDYLNIIVALKGLNSAYDNNKINTTLEQALATMPGRELRIFVDLAAAREHPPVNDTRCRRTASVRKTEPLAIPYRWYAWYLFAYCCDRLPNTKTAAFCGLILPPLTKHRDIWTNCTNNSPLPFTFCSMSVPS